VRLQIYILFTMLLMALLLNLGGCSTNKPPSIIIQDVPLMFYQAYDYNNKNNPAPFFLTIKEAQQFCVHMNAEKGNEYQIGFIAR
jgi:hypothetical protein